MRQNSERDHARKSYNYIECPSFLLENKRGEHEHVQIKERCYESIVKDKRDLNVFESRRSRRAEEQWGKDIQKYARQVEGNQQTIPLYKYRHNRRNATKVEEFGHATALKDKWRNCVDLAVKIVYKFAVQNINTH